MNILDQIERVIRYKRKAENALLRYAVYLCEERNIPYDCIELGIYESNLDIMDIFILGKTVGRIKLVYNKPKIDELYLNIVLSKAILPNLWDKDYKLVEGNTPEFIE